MNPLRSETKSTGRLLMAGPHLRGIGGVAAYARALMDALAPEPVDVLDQPVGPELFALPQNARLVGSPSHKVHYALRLAAEAARRPGPLLLAHVASTLALAPVPEARLGDVTVLMHGQEAWRRMPPHRALGLRRAHRFVFTTRYTRDLFLAVNGDRLRADVRTAVIPLSAARRLEDAAPLPVPEGRRQVVCVSRLTRADPLKGISTLLAAARHLPEGWEVVVVGDGDGREGYVREAAALGISDRVRFTGFVSDEERTRLLSEASVFCLPSAQEGFGIVVLEAMCAGRACVGAAAGALPEVIAPEAGELFPYGDERALARALLRTDARRVAGELSPERVRDFYDRTYAWNRFRSAWRALLGRGD